MKLRQNGIVSFSVKLAAFQASGWAEPRTMNLLEPRTLNPEFRLGGKPITLVFSKP